LKIPYLIVYGLQKNKEKKIIDDLKFKSNFFAKKKIKNIIINIKVKLTTLKTSNKSWLVKKDINPIIYGMRNLWASCFATISFLIANSGALFAIS